MFLITTRALLQNIKGEFLVIQRKNERMNWELPGGKLDTNISVKDNLYKELQEEIGTADLILESDFPLVESMVLEDGYKAGEVALDIVYKGTLLSQNITLSHEHMAYRWIRIEDMKYLHFTDWMRNIILKLVK